MPPGNSFTKKVWQRCRCANSARRAGITTPTVYAYFDSKNAIYDAMFGRAASEFADWVTEPLEADGLEEVLTLRAHRFVEFCTKDVARYQLLFQRTIPNFEPSAKPYAPALRALESARECLALNDVRQPKHLDLWTALLSGLVAQQVSNDPSGDRWTLLLKTPWRCSSPTSALCPRRAPRIQAINRPRMIKELAI